MASEELQHALQRVSGTTLDAQGAANVWAATGALRTNLVTNPSLGVDATGWGGAGGTRVTQGTGWAWQLNLFTTPAGMSYGPIAGSVGQFYSGSIVVSGPAGRTVSIALHDGVAYLAPILDVTLTGGPQAVALTSSVAASGTAPEVYVYPSGAGGAWTSGQMVTATNALIERVSGVGVAPGTYFDGSSPGGAWTGTPNASTSTLRERGGLELVGALNVKAGTTGLDLDGVCNALAGTPGQGKGINACAALFV